MKKISIPKKPALKPELIRQLCASDLHAAVGGTPHQISVSYCGLRE